MPKIRVLQYGIGRMGSQMVRMMLQKKDIEVVGAICGSDEEDGKDIGELARLGRKIGIKAYKDPELVCKNCKADVVLQATTSYVPGIWEQIKPAIKKGMNVITIAEEMGYPFVKYPALSKKIDAAAKKHNVSVVGSGINPGFAMDLLPLLLTGICQRVDSIKVTRLIDFSPFGPSIQKNIGIGINAAEFRKRLAAKKLPLHIGLPESAYMIAAGMKWKLDRVYETREPVLAKKTINVPGYMRVKTGKVAGFNHRCYGIVKGKKKIVLEELGRVEPKLDYKNTIQIKGLPNLTETSNVPPGNITTAAHAVNLIPVVMKARAGFLSMLDLAVAPALPLK